MNRIKEILMERDGIAPEEADALIEEFIEDARQYLDAGNVMAVEIMFEEYFGLEPDYLEDLILDL